MNNLIKLDEIFQRSRARVKGLGEVFTPDAYVEDMLKILSHDKRALWSDDTVSFFEPSCGHGNIVAAIYRKRLDSFYSKNLSLGASEAAFCAIANSLHTLWAIDVDSKNITQCRSRILASTIEFLIEKTTASNAVSVFKKNSDFMAHVLCAIAWHIHENDMLSSLSIAGDAAKSAAKTRTGSKWVSQNGHKQLHFEKTWVAYYEDCEKKNATPLQFERAYKFIKNLISGTARAVSGLEFADFMLTHSTSVRSQTRSKDTAAGL